MTFEEWFKSVCKNWSDQLAFSEMSQTEAMELAWNAAKEDSKPAVKAYFKETFHGGIDFSHWLLSPLKPGDKQWHFPCKEDAEKWAIENGYRVEES